MRKVLILLPLMVVAACSTPLQRCVADVNRGIATLDHLINIAQSNIQRGFALVEVEDVRVIRRTCRDRRQDGTEIRYRCDRVRTFTRDEPVSINIAEERVKLEQLQDRRAQAAREVNPRLQQCVAANPQ